MYSNHIIIKVMDVISFHVVNIHYFQTYLIIFIIILLLLSVYNLFSNSVRLPLHNIPSPFLPAMDVFSVLTYQPTTNDSCDMLNSNIISHFSTN